MGFLYYIKEYLNSTEKNNMNENDPCIVDLNRTLLRDGPKFLSHKIIINENIAYLKPTITAMLFCVIYIIVGIFLIGLAIYLVFMAPKYDLAIFVGGFGIAIATFGLSLIQPFLSRVSFNRESGVFNNHIDRDVKLHNIISLQINNKVIKQKHALNYPCYELNLLTEHGRRINILNHNDQSQLVRDAYLLGEFLGVEVEDCRREIIL